MLIVSLLLGISIIAAHEQGSDLLGQEITQLEELIHLQQQKLHRLKELRTALISENRTIPNVNEDLIKQGIYQSGSQPRRSNTKKTSDGYQERSFMNRLLKKFSVQVDDWLHDAAIIQTFQYRSSIDTQSSQMLVVVTNSDEIQLYDLTGAHLDTTKTRIEPYIILEQKNITFVATSSRSDDVIIATYGDGAVYIHKLESKRIAPKNGTENETAEVPQSKFSSRLKVECRIEMLFALQEQITGMTDFEYVTIKGQRYFIFSDDKGQLHVYHRNGTYYDKKTVAQTPIISIHRSFSNLLYVTKTGLGYFNPNVLETAPPYCESVPYPVVQVSVDLQQNNLVYVLTENAEIYIYEIKQNEGICKVRQRITPTAPTTVSALTHQLISLRYFLLLVDKKTKQTLVYNTSEVLSEENDIVDDPIRITLPSLKEKSKITLIPSKGVGSTHYLLVSDKQSKNRATELSYYEVIIPAKKESDLFASLRVPIIILVAVLAFGYQFWIRGAKGKSASSRNAARPGQNDRELDELLGLKPGQQRGPGGPQLDQKRLEQLTQQFDQIDKKAKTLNDTMQTQKGILKDQIRTTGLGGRPANPKKLN